MNDNHHDPTGEELNEAQLTAYALGQLDEQERAAVEAKLARSEKARRMVDETAALSGRVLQSNRETQPVGPSSALREAVEDHLTLEPKQVEESLMKTTKDPLSATPSRKRRFSWTTLAVSVCLLVAAVALVLPAMQPGRESDRESAQQMAAVDDQTDPSATRNETRSETTPLTSASARKGMQVAGETVALDPKASPTTAQSKPGATSLAVADGGSDMTESGLSFLIDSPMGLAGQLHETESSEVPFPDESPLYYRDPKVWEDLMAKRSERHGSARVLRQNLFVNQLYQVEKGHVPLPDEPPIVYPDAEVWKELTSRRAEPYGSMSLSASGVPVSGDGSHSMVITNDGRPAPADPSITVIGKTGRPGVFSADLDVPFTQENFAPAVPGYGGSSPGEVALPADSSDRVVVHNRRSVGGVSSADLDIPTSKLAFRNMMYEVAEKPTVATNGNAAGTTQRYGINGQTMADGSVRVEDVTLKENFYTPLTGGQATIEGKTESLSMMVTPQILIAEEEEVVLGILPPVDERLKRNDPATFGTEQYDPIIENAFLTVAEQPLSTFSVDVDTASYANVRRFLREGRLPPPSAVRIEELVNYFSYDYPAPDDETPFSVDMEVAECPWNGEHRLVRVGLKGKEIDAQQRGPTNLVFLLDVSGSMRADNKLALVKQAMAMLVDQLTEDDRVAIVTYASGTDVRLPSTGGHEREVLLSAIDALTAGGSTHGSAGIQLAYEQALTHFVEGGTNRVILCTDGDLNVGITDDDELVKLITEKATSGVFLTVLGFGTGNLKDSKMEKLADKGNGSYAYIDGLREARKVLVEQVSGTLITIAKDVKLQIEFNPAEVASYRLIGYENRTLAAKDFRDDKKDAGEIGAGHTVTALYEIVPAGSGQASATAKEGLKYQKPRPAEQQPLSEAAQSGELLTLRLRYKQPDGQKSSELEFTLEDSEKRFGEASTDFRFASAVASFGMVLRRSQHAGDATLAAVEEFAAGAIGEDSHGYRSEFVDLVRRARQLGGR